MKIAKSLTTNKRPAALLGIVLLIIIGWFIYSLPSSEMKHLRKVLAELPLSTYVAEEKDGGCDKDLKGVTHCEYAIWMKNVDTQSVGQKLVSEGWELMYSGNSQDVNSNDYIYYWNADYQTCLIVQPTRLELLAAKDSVCKTAIIQMNYRKTNSND